MEDTCNHCGYRFNIEYESICPVCSTDNSKLPTRFEMIEAYNDLKNENDQLKEFIEWAVDISLDKRIHQQGKELLNKLNS